jgi:RimJ/RimL family protein N-acetyltransferase
VILIRDLEPGDRALLVEGFERLSPESRYRRFFAPISRLTDRQLDYLTQVDQHDHVALIAIDEEGGVAVGVARFVRTGPGVAEPAIVVTDDWQGRGVGGALLGRLVQRAHEEGVARFVAPVLAQNEQVTRALKRLGDTTIEQHGPELELTIELPVKPLEPESPLRRLLRAVAAGTVDPALVFWHRLLPRRGLPRDQLRNVIVSDDGEAAVSVAAEIAAASGASLVLVAAGHPLIDNARELKAGLDRQAEQLRGRVSDIRTTGRLGDLGAILLDEAITERARLIVVSDAGGDADVVGRLLGRTWDHVSHHARCDVLIARGRP